MTRQEVEDILIDEEIRYDTFEVVKIQNATRCLLVFEGVCDSDKVKLVRSRLRLKDVGFSVVDRRMFLSFFETAKKVGYEVETLSD